MRVLVFLAAALAWADVEEKDTIRQSLPGARSVEVDNIHGSIHVTGVEGGEVRLVVNRRATAPDQSTLEAARREVRLDISSAGGAVRLYVDGPFRKRSWSIDYTVRYDFELEVPRDADLKLRTVNEGGIVVTGVRGRFDVSHVNGPVEMKGLRGSGAVRTVNGGIKLAFEGEPREPLQVKTVNGQIAASFPRSLNAGLSFKTLNGDVYTDFEFQPANQPMEGEQRDGKWIYRKRHQAAVKVGAGGPGHQFETVNGNIRILEAKQ